MVDLSPIGVSKDKSLQDLNTIVSQREAILGPLVKIGNDGSKETVLTFDSDQEPPAKHAVISVTVVGEAIIPSGSTKVAEGKVFIAGGLMGAVATRPS